MKRSVRLIVVYVLVLSCLPLGNLAHACADLIAVERAHHCAHDHGTDTPAPDGDRDTEDAPCSPDCRCGCFGNTFTLSERHFKNASITFAPEISPPAYRTPLYACLISDLIWQPPRAR